MLQFPMWKIALVALVCLLGIVYAAPNMFARNTFGEVPSGVPGRQINLGLDLQGGSYLLLQVDTAVVVQERLESIVESARRELRDAKIGYLGLGVHGKAAAFDVREAGDLEKARQLARGLDTGITVNTEGDRVTVELTEDAVADLSRNAVQQSIEIVRRRVDETGTREPLIQRQGNNRILIQLPGIDNPERIKALIGQTAKLTFHLVDTTASVSDAMNGRVPPGSKVLPSVDNQGPSHYVVKRRVMISGENLVDSQPSFQDNRPVVSFRFDSIGGRRFGQATTENVGRPFAIVLDDKVISAPVIREPILGGTGIISGSFSVQEAQDLALLLRAGALPAPLTVLEERSVGPGLGADSIAAGKVASIVGLVLVICFMVVAYGLFGIFANMALLLNIGLILGALSALQATLTLPGIAGIVLTIGMAVDANVLVFERVREEIDNGRSPINALDAGYRRAFTTIVDSNLTTLFAAVFLFALGAGPVKGFAVTLGIGIMTSMFTAVMVTRLFVAMWVRYRRPATLPI
ncbi:protein translocase subunit SecD [Thalassobaculum sp.]|uniref:protein translocase subunit SecD n=1 Tax=Thalassobaculum sp. TaxID=2022740 RepID=UPI0032EEEA96